MFRYFVFILILLFVGPSYSVDSFLTLKQQLDRLHQVMRSSYMPASMFVEYQFVQVPRAIITNELHQMGRKVVLMNDQAPKFEVTG